MTGKRTRYPAEFKAKVALEAIRGELTVSAGGSIAATPNARTRRSALGGRTPAEACEGTLNRIRLAA